MKSALQRYSSVSGGRGYAHISAGRWSSKKNVVAPEEVRLVQAEGKHHVLIVATTCKSTDCVEKNCADLAVDCTSRVFITKKHGLASSSVEEKALTTRVIANLTHSIPSDKEGIKISDSDYQGHNKNQYIVYEKLAPRVNPRSLKLDLNATQFVNCSTRYDTILKTPVGKNNWTLADVLSRYKNNDGNA